MPDALAALEQIYVDVAALAVACSGRVKKVSPPAVQPLVRRIALGWFASARGHVEAIQTRAGLCDEIDFVIRALMQLTNEVRAKTAYAIQLAELRPSLQEAMIDVMKASAVRLVLSTPERKILDTLLRMLPATAASYEQALIDISGGKRVSWRGTGAELREVLREVMDHLAPDNKVMAAPGFRLEDRLSRPTQKQRVRFILRARRVGSAAVEVAEATLDTVEESVAALARSTYQRGAAATHGGVDGLEVRKLKGYVDALLVDLLEIVDWPAAPAS